jgi:hypothetical protein
MSKARSRKGARRAPGAAGSQSAAQLVDRYALSLLTPYAVREYQSRLRLFRPQAGYFPASLGAGSGGALVASPLSSSGSFTPVLSGQTSPSGTTQGPSGGVGSVPSPSVSPPRALSL